MRKEGGENWVVGEWWKDVGCASRIFLGPPNAPFTEEGAKKDEETYNIYLPLKSTQEIQPSN